MAEVITVIKIVAFNLAGALIAAGLLVMQSDGWTGAQLWLLGLGLNLVGVMIRPT